jgi:hypothetical protein
MYRLMGRAHATLAGWRRGQSGQGTVEYVALILLVRMVNKAPPGGQRRLLLPEFVESGDTGGNSQGVGVGRQRQGASVSV